MPAVIGAVLIVILLVGVGVANAADTVTTPVVTLQDSLVSIITQVQSGVQAGVSFLSAEIPDVIRQLLIWKAVEASVWAFVGLLFLLLNIPILRWAFKYHETYEECYFPGHIMAGVCYLLVSTPIVFTVFSNLLTVLQIWVAPKVWLIEYAASLVK